MSYVDQIKALPQVLEGEQPKFKENDFVWLGEFEEEPRQTATIIAVDSYSWGVGYIVQVKPEDKHDDGLREITEDQIEGLAQDA